MRSLPRIAFVVNGEPQSAMSHRAGAFARRLENRYRIALYYRQGGKVRSLGRFGRDLLRFGPGAVYVFDMAWSGVAAGLAYRLISGTPVIIDTGDAITELARSMGRGRLGVALTSGLERVSLALANEIVVRGSYHQEWLQRKRVAATVITDGVETELFRARAVMALRRQLGVEEVLTVGLVGSSVWSEKLQTCYGWDLVELISLLRHRRVKGVLIGGGSGIAVLQQRCQQLGILDRMVFLGYTPYEQLADYLSLMDVCLSTQTNDLPGMVRTTGKLPLYLASGRYILASKVGEAARVLPEEMLVDYHGLVDKEYPGRLAERMEKLLAHPELLKRGAENVVLARERFDYDVLAEQVDGVLQRVLSRSRLQLCGLGERP